MDKETFAEKVLAAELTLYHVAKTILHNDTLCEDAVQEGILKAYEKLNTLKEEAYFKTWLTRIVINECYSQQRKAKATVPWEEWAENEAAEEKDDYSELYQAIRRLKPRFRIVVVLYYIEGYSVKEISDILRIPAGTVKSRLAKGRDMLKKYMKGGVEYEEDRLGKYLSGGTRKFS
ncbi:MAG: RNA polymerase sigma factor [Ruminococcus sp.]|jgi:RNA polymerase sigma-70 factor (ECF subfamily)